MSAQQQANINENEPLSFDETVRRALAFCDSLPDDFAQYRAQLAELRTRLSDGRLHFAVLGQFNRGKSTFINSLLGIKALPASVLPLTSVPTVIEYGTEQMCKIRFTDGKEDLVVRDAAEVMEGTLRLYVAEESNPKNKFCVRDAVVSCKSDLLVNGTVLIDTPGFGSTHLHNTQTTLDLLIECDAALFLLSADPPMTQTEMEFLKHVKERVPKIFFILNKVDLLTPEGLDEVDRFIKNILCRDLGFPGDTALYRTSAIKGSDAASGLDAVKKQVLDFMIREKYFTLSEALRDKYAEATVAIRSLLENKLAALTAPLTCAKDEIGAITAAIQSLGLELESQIKSCAEEKEALDVKINTWTNENLNSYNMSMDRALDVLLTGKYFPTEAASIASSMLPKHANDMGARLLSVMLELANKSIRALALRHALAFSGLQKRYAELLRGSSIKPHEPEKLAGHLEIVITDYRKFFEAAPQSWDVPQPQVMDIFRKKSARFEAIREFYQPLCAESVAAIIAAAGKQARTTVDAAWENMRGTMHAGYQEMIDYLRQVHREKQEKLDRNQTAVRPEAAFLREKIGELKTLM
jgi:GTPase Era involved in 16S rRNA processing